MTITCVIGRSLPILSLNSFLMVLTTRPGPSLWPPISNAALILFSPWPGMSTFRSRGIDMTVTAEASASARASRIVSDRGGLLRAAPMRLSEPSTMNVRGPPGGGVSSSGMRMSARPGLRVGARVSVGWGHAADVGTARLADRVEDVVELAQRSGRHRGRRDDHHEQAREQRAQRKFEAHPG